MAFYTFKRKVSPLFCTTLILLDSMPKCFDICISVLILFTTLTLIVIQVGLPTPTVPATPCQWDDKSYIWIYGCIYSHACKFLQQANGSACFYFNLTRGILRCLPHLCILPAFLYPFFQLSHLKFRTLSMCVLGFRQPDFNSRFLVVLILIPHF